MKTLTIEQLRAGMELSRDVTHVTGRVLLEAGRVLEEKDLKTLKAWGVTEVQVVAREGCDSEQPEDVAPEEIARAIGKISHAFRYANLEHPFMAELFRLSQEHYIRQGSGVKR